MYAKKIKKPYKSDAEDELPAGGVEDGLALAGGDLEERDLALVVARRDILRVRRKRHRPRVDLETKQNKK